MDDVSNSRSPRGSSEKSPKSKENLSYSGNKRTFNLPNKSLSPERSPSKYTTSDKLSTREYARHPELYQIMLNYLDMDAFLELYVLNHESFESKEILGILAERFGLWELKNKKLVVPENFKQLLKLYDIKYATVGSYNRIKSSLTHKEKLEEAGKILSKASKQGNIQAVINGFKLYPDLLKETILNEALQNAAESGSEPIIDLLLDLGATSKNNQILMGAIIGGHPDLLTGNKYIQFIRPMGIEYYKKYIDYAIKHEQLESLKYLFSLSDIANSSNVFLYDAGVVGNKSIIEYLITQGADYYVGLVVGTMIGKNFNVFMKYINKIDMNNNEVRNEVKGRVKDFFKSAVEAGRLDILKFLINHKLVTKDVLDNAYIYRKTINTDIIRYLESVM